MTCLRQLFRHCTNARLDRALAGWHLAWIWTQRDFLMKGSNAISLGYQSQVLRPCSWVFPCPKVSVADGPKTNIHKLQSLVLHLTVAKEVEKEWCSCELHTGLERFMLILNLERKKKYSGSSTSEGVCLLLLLWKNWQAQALWLQEP